MYVVSRKCSTKNILVTLERILIEMFSHGIIGHKNDNMDIVIIISCVQKLNLPVCIIRNQYDLEFAALNLPCFSSLEEDAPSTELLLLKEDEFDIFLDLVFGILFPFLLLREGAINELTEDVELPLRIEDSEPGGRN